MKPPSVLFQVEQVSTTMRVVVAIYRFEGKVAVDLFFLQRVTLGYTKRTMVMWAGSALDPDIWDPKQLIDFANDEAAMHWLGLNFPIGRVNL